MPTTGERNSSTGNVSCCGSYDWTMDQISYTWGALAELNQKFWAFRAGYFLVPAVSNTDNFDMRFSGRRVYRRTRIALFAPLAARQIAADDMGQSRQYGHLCRGPRRADHNRELSRTLRSMREVRTNYGFAANLEQAITDDLGVFARASWSPVSTKSSAGPIATKAYPPAPC